MSKLERHLPLMQTKAGMTLTRDQLEVNDLQTQEAALRLHHHERLARLFRHVSDNADDRYLRDIVTRYRKVESS